MTEELKHCSDEKVELPAPEICKPICGKIDVVDGTYGSVTIVSGCIVSAQDCQLPVYTPPVCCAEDGGGSTGGGDTSINLLADACNLMNSSGGEYYVKPVFADSSTIAWTGCGTSASPFTATGATQSGGTTIVGGDCITATNNGTSWVISHTPALGGTTDGITTDSCGHITAIDLSSVGALTVKPGSSLVINNGEISIASSPAAGTYTLGGTSITVDGEGRVTAISYTAIPAGTFTTVDGKTVSYDASGVITSVV